MLQTYLVNILIFCGILLLIALIVGMVQIIIVLVDVRRASKEIKNKILALTSVFDIVSMVLGGLGSAKKKVKLDSSNFAAFAAGLKKALQIFFKK